jgi:hypothetical protein
MKKLITVLLTIFLITSIPQTQAIAATDYYFDSINGNDTNACSLSAPCKTLVKMNSIAYGVGDIINLKSGSSWAGDLIISRPNVTFHAYGIGARPIVETTGQYAIRISTSNVTVEGLLIRGAVYSGVYINSGANYNTIRDNEITAVGIGVAVNGNNNIVTQNYIHDLKMVVNDVGGNGNDYGAVGVELFNGPNEVSYNRMINCRAPSYDFGYDGGAVEIYLLYGNADGSSFHHNYAENTDGFIEFHSVNLLYSANNVIVSYNVINKTKSLADIGLPGYGGGHELKSANNIVFEYNTYVDYPIRPSSDWAGGVITFHGVSPTASQVIVRYNIIYTNNDWFISNVGTFSHTYNVYYLILSRSSLGFTLDATEKRTDPLFVNVANSDFNLQVNSPACGMGALPCGAVIPTITPLPATATRTATPAPTQTPIPSTATRTATITPVPPTAILPTATSAMECILFPVHNIEVCIP